MLLKVDVVKFNDKFFLSFYNKILQFFEYFIQNNDENSRLLVPCLKNFMNLALIPYDRGESFGEQGK